MKLPLLALLCAATAALCQSPTPPRMDPDKMFQLPDKFSTQGPDFKTFKALPPMKNELFLGDPPVEAPRPKLNDPQIDPKIIVHPPWPDKGDKSNGQDVSHDLYPQLKFLPIHHVRPIR
jgi:hypothetical protein